MEEKMIFKRTAENRTGQRGSERDGRKSKQDEEAKWMVNCFSVYYLLLYKRLSTGL